ncbi:MAG: dihydrolipoamide acetyltransferase family protein [Thermoleophilia bacterium]
MAELTMPALGADMTSGRLLEWHVAPGDRVAKGDIVATVDTDKAEIDIETFHGGVVEQILVEPGTKVDVGAVLATIAGNGASAAPAAPAPAPAAPAPAPAPASPPEAAGPPPESAAPPPEAAASPPEAAAPPPVSAAPPPESAAPPPAPAAPPFAPGRHRRRVSPLARRTAAELGIDVESITGSGPQGAVTQVDVQRAAAAAAPAPPAVAPPAVASPPAAERRSAEDRLASLNRAVGELMARSKREIPHYYLQREIDMSAALDWLDAHNARCAPGERILPAALLLRAAALAAHDVPEVNGTFEQGAFRPAPHVDLGVAVSLRSGGVIAPVIPAADTLALPELMAALRALTARARRGKLHGRDISGGTLTVTSLGEHGADLVHGVIFAPQVALVGFGRIAARPWAVGDMVGSRRVVTATLAADHRVSDGHRGSLYLSSLDHHLQEPEQL